MKVCPNCQTTYPDDANFCPEERCATADGPRRLEAAAEVPAQRYRLESQIGGRHTGEVWRAVDTQSGQTVAYKRIARASLATPAAAERALRELKQLQRAQSPRIARVLDFGREPDETIFLVTDLFDGRPLDQLVAEAGTLPLDRTKKILAQVGDALLEGQKVGVVHHDLAAKNVLVDANDEVKVINFVAPFPAAESVFGVPEYLSPEQAEGKLVDQRSNTYSLGALMTLMLTGKPPFSGADSAAVLAEVVKGEIVPPSRRVEGLTPEIDRAVLRAMDKSPNRRPLTLRQFLTEVSGLVAMGGGGSASGDSGRTNTGFSKTIMFGAGSAEAQRLAAEAMTARASLNGAGATGATAAVASAPGDRAANEAVPTSASTENDEQAESGGTATPPLQSGPRRVHGAAISATVVAMPAARLANAGEQATLGPVPNPVNLEQPPGAAGGTSAAGATQSPSATGEGAPPATGKGGAGGKFRETLWFKKGDVDQMVAEARARVQATRARPTAPESAELPAEAAEPDKPLEERYVDDGSITAEDRKKFSLRSGPGSTGGTPPFGSVPGDRMSDNEVVKEIGGGKKVTVIVIAAAAIVVTIIVVLAAAFHGKSVSKSANALSSETAPAAAPTPPASAPPAPSPPPPAPTPPPAASAAAPSGAAAGSSVTGEAPSDDDAHESGNTAAHAHVAAKPQKHAVKKPPPAKKKPATPHKP